MEPFGDSRYLIPQLNLPFPDLLTDDKRTEYLAYGVPMYQAALKGDWEAAEAILHSYPPCLTARISTQGDTALHIAVASNHNAFVKYLVSQLSPQNLGVQNLLGNTPLMSAVTSGNVSIARVLVEAYRMLPNIRSSAGLSAIQLAAQLGLKAMVLYLWPLSDNLTQYEHVKLIISTIKTDLCDVALEILELYPELAVARDEHDETPLHVLARSSIKKCTINKLPCEIEVWIARGLAGRIHLDALAHKLARVLWEQVKRQSESSMSSLIDDPWPLVFEATKKGNFEFLVSMIEFYPDAIWIVDSNQQSIFHVAVQHRQATIFGLIFKIYSQRQLLLNSTDDQGNNILHVAARLPPIANRFNGRAALEMHHEIWWFKVVEKLMEPQFREAKNSEGKTPRDIFVEEHEELIKEGKRWIRNIASLCTIVLSMLLGVLISLFQNVKDVKHGYPFMFAITTSFLISTWSLHKFLTILMSKNTNDFFDPLLRKLSDGLYFFGISLVLMMVTINVVLLISFEKYEIWWFSILVCGWLIFGREIVLFFVEVSHSVWYSSD